MSQAAAPVRPLILLTNDDGYDAPGLLALTETLAALGELAVVAPDHNWSASGHSLTLHKPMRARNVLLANGTPAIITSGSPADCVALACLGLVARKPDLVVSGINHGPNSGALLMLSGTLGAAMAGTLLLDPPVPGIAVSAARLLAAEPVDSPANRAQLEAVSAHVPRLIAAARGWFCRGGQVARARTVLNVNYPARPVTELRGTVVTRQGASTDLHVTFDATASGEYLAHTSRGDASDGRDTDNSWLRQGYVTVTPVSGLLDGEQAPRADLKTRLRGL